MADELSLPFDHLENDYHELPPADLNTIHRRVCWKSESGWVAPNVFDWRAGDVIIFKPPAEFGPLNYATRTRDALTWQMISTAQTLLGSKNPEFFHVAIYGGSGMVWESVGKHGVRIRHLKSVLNENLTITIRRIMNKNIDEAKLRYYLEENVGESYGISVGNVSSFLGPLIQRWRRQTLVPFPANRLDTFEGPVVCSQFVNRVLKLTVNQQQILLEEPPLPYDFVESLAFETIDVQWCRVGPPPNVRLVPPDLPPA